MQDSCCGNLVCEAGESGGSCSDCGPFTLTTPLCSTCWTPHGAMFDVEAITDVVLTSLTFRVYSGFNSINVYTAPGSFSPIATNPNAWTLIASGTVGIPGKLLCSLQYFRLKFLIPLTPTLTFMALTDWTFVQADFTDIPLSAGSMQTFYIATSAQLTASDDTSNPLSSDDHLKFLNPAGLLPRTEFEFLYSGTYSW